MAGPKIPGKCFADFVVGINWVFFVVTAVFFGALIGYWAGYLGANNVLVNKMVGDLDPYTKLTDAQTNQIAILGVILAVALLLQAFLNLLLNRGVREGHTGKLTAWLAISFILWGINSLSFVYKLSAGTVNSTEDILCSFIGLVWYGVTLLAIKYYRNNVIYVRNANAIPEVAAFQFEKSPMKV
jgi:hypothetical protein